MPQTSPMIWLIMSSSIPVMMTSLFSYFSFNSMNPKNNQNHSLFIYKKNFNWTW